MLSVRVVHNNQSKDLEVDSSINVLEYLTNYSRHNTDIRWYYGDNIIKPAYAQFDIFIETKTFSKYKELIKLFGGKLK